MHPYSEGLKVFRSCGFKSLLCAGEAGCTPEGASFCSATGYLDDACTLAVLLSSTGLKYLEGEEGTVQLLLGAACVGESYYISWTKTWQGGISPACRILQMHWSNSDSSKNHNNLLKFCCNVHKPGSQKLVKIVLELNHSGINYQIVNLRCSSCFLCLFLLAVKWHKKILIFFPLV